MRWQPGGTMPRWVVLAAICLAGCGRAWKEYEFVEEYPQRMCDRAVACAWVDDFETCVTERSDEILLDQEECQTYDGLAVDDCFDEIRALGCGALEYADPGLHPITCRYVFDCSFNPT